MKKSFLIAFFFALPAWSQVVQEMSCAQARSFASANGYYWKLLGSGDVVRIYPVLSQAQCPRHSFAAPLVERTADTRQCVLGFYCRGRMGEGGGH